MTPVNPVLSFLELDCFANRLFKKVSARWADTAGTAGTPLPVDCQRGVDASADNQVTARDRTLSTVVVARASSIASSLVGLRTVSPPRLEASSL